MDTLLKKCSIVLALSLLMTCTACDAASDDTSSDNYADIVLGEDHTDLTAKLTFMTYRTDLIADDPAVIDFQDYKKEFNEMYPNIDIMFEGIPDYDLDMSTRLSSGNWDICCIPSTTPDEELPTYFEPISQYSELADKYEFINVKEVDGSVYGIPAAFNVQGIVYNKKVWEDAGITDMPATPDAFIDALQKIRDNTDAIPLYTNYAAGWTLTAWDFYDLTAVGNTDYRYLTLPYETDPFTKQSNNTGLYEIYNILYRAVSEGLTEEDPSDTNWELCKASINNGEIGCMVLGSWAVPQMQGGGSHPEDIGYMPFPISVDGVQYAIGGADYCYGINQKATDEKKLAAKIFVKYLTEKSNYAVDQGGISIVKGAEYPNVFGDFEGVQLLMEPSPPKGETNMYALISETAGLNLGTDPAHMARIIDSALDGSESIDEIMADWNKAWTEAQKECISEE